MLADSYWPPVNILISRYIVCVLHWSTLYCLFFVHCLHVAQGEEEGVGGKISSRGKEKGGKGVGGKISTLGSKASTREILHSKAPSLFSFEYIYMCVFEKGSFWIVCTLVCLKGQLSTVAWRSSHLIVFVFIFRSFFLKSPCLQRLPLSLVSSSKATPISASESWRRLCAASSEQPVA